MMQPNPFPRPTDAPTTPHEEDPSRATMSNLHLVNPSLAANPKHKRLDENMNLNVKKAETDKLTTLNCDDQGPLWQRPVARPRSESGRS